MEDSKREEYLRVLFHELGHWLMAKQVGFDPLDIKLKIERPNDWYSYGSCTTVLYRQCESLQNAADYLYHRQLVLEAHYNQGSYDSLQSSLYKGRASDDNTKLMELLYLSLNLKMGTVEATMGEIEAKHCAHDDGLHHLLMRAKDQLITTAFLIADDQNVSKFINEGIKTFDSVIEEQGDTGSLIISGELLQGNYERCEIDCLVPTGSTGSNAFDKLHL